MQNRNLTGFSALSGISARTDNRSQTVAHQYVAAGNISAQSAAKRSSDVHSKRFVEMSCEPVHSPFVMSAIMSERRKAHRFVVDPDRAEVTVKAGSSHTAAVLTDLSSTGIGLLMLRGLHLSAGQVIKVEIEDVVHDCEVVDCVAEEMYQRVGARRLKEHFDMPDPMKAIIAKSGANDMSAVGSVLAITLGLCVAALIFGVIQTIDFGGPTDPAQKTAAAAAAAEARPRVISEAERLKNERDRMLKEAAAELKERARQNEEQAAILITGTGDFSWSALVSQLRLSKTQQRDLMQLVESGTNGNRKLSPLELRQEASALLTDSQRKHIKRMLSAGRF